MTTIKPIFVGTFGILAFLSGMLLRLTSGDLAGPRNHSYAAAVDAYNDVGVALLVLGVGLLIVVAHATLSAKKVGVRVHRKEGVHTASRTTQNVNRLPPTTSTLRRDGE